MAVTVNEAFKRFRQKFNLSKSDVAQVLNIKPASYEYEKNDKEANPTAKTLLKLADTYNVSVDYLLGRTDNPRGFQPIQNFDSNEDLKKAAEALMESSRALEKVLAKQVGA